MNLSDGVSGVDHPGVMQTLGAHHHTLQYFKIMFSSKSLNKGNMLKMRYFFFNYKNRQALLPSGRLRCYPLLLLQNILILSAVKSQFC